MRISHKHAFYGCGTISECELNQIKPSKRTILARNLSALHNKNQVRNKVMETTIASTYASTEDASANHEKLSRNFQNETFFTSFDYVLFCIMLMMSAAIGIYFGFFAKRKQNNTTEYLLGGKNMNFFPIAASLIASHVNGFTMLAVPAEVYANGSEYSLCVISAALVGSINISHKIMDNFSTFCLYVLDGRCINLHLSASIL